MENILENILRIFSAIVLCTTVNGKETTPGHLKLTTGIHSILSPWIGSVGCFNVTRGYRSVSLTGNGVAECLFHCNTTYIGLQLDTCLCLGERDTNPDKLWNREASCRKCASPSSDKCGSVTAVSVYTKIHSKPPTPDEFSQRCGFVNCTQTTCVYYQGLCSNKYQGICESKALTDKGTWSETIQFCRTGSSDLLGLHGTQFPGFNLTYGTNYWLNIFRTDFLPAVEMKGVQSTTPTALVSETVNSSTPDTDTVQSTTSTPISGIVESTTWSPASKTVNVYTPGYMENKTVNWNNPNTNISPTSAGNQVDTKDSGMVIAIVVVCLLFVVAVVAFVAVIFIRRRKRSMKKRPSRIAIVSPISRSSNSYVDQEHYATVSNVENSASDSEVKMATTSEGHVENGGGDENIEIGMLPQTYYEMKSMKELAIEDSENLDYMYKVPVYHTEEYVPMRNSENGKETIETSADDKTHKMSVAPQHIEDKQKDKQNFKKETRTESDLKNEIKNDEGDDFDPEYYPVIYVDKSNQENDEAMLDKDNKSENENGVNDDFEPDYYPVVISANKTNESSDKQTYASNALYGSKVATGRASDVISQTAAIPRNAVSNGRGTDNQPHVESIYDYPKPRIHSAETSPLRSQLIEGYPQSNSGDDLLKTYDMADNGGDAREFEDSIYEPVEVNNQ